MIQSHFPPQQRSSEHKASLPTNRRHSLVSNRFVAPDEDLPAANHSPEKISILAATSKLGPEWLLYPVQYASPEEQVASSPFRPSYSESGLVRRPLKKIPRLHPLRRL